MQLTKRRLTDLWVTGKELTLDDGQGEPVVVWIQKMNMVESAESARNANAQRAKILALRGHPERDEFLAVRNAVLDFSEDPAEVVEFLLMDDKARAVRSTEAQLANDERWSHDDYIQGLRDAWGESLEKLWLEDKTHPEAMRVHDELEAFAKEVNEAVDAEIDVLRESFRLLSMDDLRDRMTDRMLDVEANQEWMHALHRCQIYYGTRLVENRKERYFLSKAEVDELNGAVYERLRVAYDALEVDISEGKDLPAPTDSSPSSEPPSEEATEVSSGLAAVGA